MDVTSVCVSTPGCPSPARTGQASLAREEGTLLLAGFNLELAGSPVPSQFNEIAWACTAAPVLNLVLLLNLACSCTTSTAVLYLSTYLQLGTSLLVPEDYPVAI